MDLISSLLTPWLALAAVLVPLAYAERWIHSHLFGVGWLLTNEPRSATVLYYLILLPGVFLHEFVQWLVAGALNVETERVMAWPEAQEDGTLRLDFVNPKGAGRIKTAIIGAVPLIVGLVVIGYISTRILDLDAFLVALQSADITVIGPAARDLASTADFYLWLYLMFAIANAMMPTPEERSGWWIVLAMFAGVVVFLVIIGVGDVLIETFTGPVAHGVSILTTAFGTILAVEIAAIFVIDFFEEVLERVTGRKFRYASAAEPERTSREPGSNLPLLPGEPFPSIYNLELPLPDPSIQAELDVKKRRPAPAAPARPSPAESRPAREPDAARAFERPAPLPQQRETPRPSGEPLRPAPAPASGLRPAPGSPEERRAPTPPQRTLPGGEPPRRLDQPAARQDVPPRREPASGPTRERPAFDRPATERPATPARTVPAPASAPTGAFTNRPLPGKPGATADRPRPASASPGEPVKPPERPARPSTLGTPRPGDASRDRAPVRPFRDADLDDLDKLDDFDEIDKALPDTSASDDDEIEYVDFDDP